MTIVTPTSTVHLPSPTSTPNTWVAPEGKLELGAIRPVLRTTAALDAQTLSSEHFPAQPANIALSADFRVCFTSPHAAMDSGLLSFQEVRVHQLTCRQLWQHSQNNVVEAACTSPATASATPSFLGRGQGAHFRLRPARVLLDITSQGFQLHSLVSPTSAWLTHPRLFSAIHSDLSARLGTNQLSYFCPEPELLFAVPARDTLPAAQSVAAHWANSPALITVAPIRCHSGYPHVLTDW
ncbi:hypothetical protein [Corynebacterium epidermidicanis]|uniref:Uncharacterized protein n=1 Tax=Corynebacterium epidermidicanis TaxID=1050174 RepID=A0A0G3GQL0_9CORY|nr:hypothetical protein [Corynebacterium epidermidicanis]AKK03486.1 hypothetical protein CEPID_08180 [Corynebacterium epidermidicanis]